MRTVYVEPENSKTFTQNLEINYDTVANGS